MPLDYSITALTEEYQMMIAKRNHKRIFIFCLDEIEFQGLQWVVDRGFDSPPIPVSDWGKCYHEQTY